VTALVIAAGVEGDSEHPIAKAVSAAAAGLPRGRPPAPAIRDFESTQGGGAAATLLFSPASRAESPPGPLGDGWLSAAVGKPSYLAGLDMPLGDQLTRIYHAAARGGGTPVAVGWQGAGRAVLVLRDEPKPSSADAIVQLRELGVTPYLLTGDARGAALAVAAAVGIPPVHVAAEVTPGGKVAEVRRLQAAGKVVAMVGDGVNDAAALAAADLGVAMGSGADAAKHAADISLAGSDLAAVPQAIRLSRAAVRIIDENLFWAFFYNVAMLPLAAAGLANPMVAGAAMAVSSVLVVGNSLRLERFGRRARERSRG
jgi:Cu+-exporting ATPase